MSFEADERDVLSGLEIVANGITMPLEGEAFVQFSSAVSAEKAIEKHVHNITRISSAGKSKTR